jgi:epoxyqueuosine reductase
MEPDPEIVKPKLKPLLTISNREFKENFGKISGSWRGKKPIQRNAIIALAHYKDTSAIPDLLSLIKNDPRPVIRGTAAWAIGRIGDPQPQTLEVLKNHLTTEQDPDVLKELEKGIAMLVE